MNYVYLSGPIRGLSYSKTTSWREEFVEGLADDIIALSPMRGKDYLSGESVVLDSYEVVPLSSQRGIVTRDRNDVTRCDVLVGYLAGAEAISIGTIFEYAWAYLLRKPIITIVKDASWESNIHNHPFMREVTDYHVEDVDHARHIVEMLLSNGV